MRTKASPVLFIVMRLLFLFYHFFQKNLDKHFKNEIQLHREKLKNEFSVAEAAHLDANPDSRALDLNITVGAAKSTANDDPASCIREFCKCLASDKEEIACKDGFSKAKGFNLDLNADEMSSSNNNDPFYPYKNYKLMKQREDFESGSSVGSLEQNDSIDNVKRSNKMIVCLRHMGIHKCHFEFQNHVGGRAKMMCIRGS